jgi:LysR family transcriptional regulator (chromosome initiation inhibitor)
MAEAYRAPAIIFNRKDELHHKLFKLVLGEVPDDFPVNYIPSAEKFMDGIAIGIGYGMLPFQQAKPLIRTGRLVDLAPDYVVPVKLYWHCWNIKSKPLMKFTQQLIFRTKTLLDT